MYAIVRATPYNSERLASADREFAEFRELHRAQPGYQGNIEIELRKGRRLTVTLWETETDSEAGRSVLGPEVERLLGPAMAGPSEIIGVGVVAFTDLEIARRPK